ncbi:hypothetical protein T439DRAFT_87826 [Meredithblackwellia eburnea MCA 4105]
MMYGSFTVKTKSSSRTTTNNHPEQPTASTSKLPIQPPQPRRISSVPDPSDSGESSNDSDFGSKAREKVKREVERDEQERMSKLKGKRGRGRPKKVKDDTSGEEEHERKMKKRKKKNNIVTKSKAPKPMKELGDLEESGMSLTSDNDDDSLSSDGTPPSAQPSSSISKPKASTRRSTGGGAYKRARGAESDDEDDLVERHVEGKWRSKWQNEHPEYMSKGRKELEERYNPLVELLDIKIQVIDSDEEKGKSVRSHARAGADDDFDTSSDSANSTGGDDPPPPTRRTSTTRTRPEPSKEYVPNKGWLPANHLSLDSSDEDKEDSNPFPNPPRPSSSTSRPSTPAVITLDSDDEPQTEDEEVPASAALVSHLPDSVEKELIDEIVIDDDDDEEEEEEDLLAKKMRLKAEAAAKVKEKEEARKKKSKETGEGKRKGEEKGTAGFDLAAKMRELRKAAKGGDVESMQVDEGSIHIQPAAADEERSIEAQRLHSQAIAGSYPKKAHSGCHPKFPIQNEKQELMGPHALGPGAEIPAPINRFLRPYQRQGVEFMYRQHMKGMGGVLGDDMGLGKTIQVIAFLSAIMRKTGTRKGDKGRRKTAVTELATGQRLSKPSSLGATCFIACPASVVHNWRREFETWGYFDVGIFEGSEKKEVIERFKRGYLDVVIAGIEATRQQIGLLDDLDFTVVIVDEAHRVKNPKSRTTIALNQFTSRGRFGLTGTAIQNRLEEFWCILDWANPGRVGTKKNWNLYISRPLKMAQKVDADQETIAIGRTRAKALVDNLLPHFWLRRTKESVKLQLPEKRDQIVLCPLTDTQRHVYQTMLGLRDVQRILTHDQPCGETDSHGRPFERGKCCDQDWPKLILKYITLFQKISNHLALIYPDNEERLTNPDKFNQDLEWTRTAFPDDWDTRNIAAITRSSFDNSLCGKWTILEKLLQMWYDQGDKVLIFSLSLKVLEIVKNLMRDTSYNFECLDGSVPADERMKLVDSFNEDPDVFCFLISTRAGGVGLNLTAANRVVIFDPNWNPSHDLQAMDRAYRFGQKRDVDVFRLIGAGTLEELIYNRQQYKRQVANIGYNATAERRVFGGVEGEKAMQGELFGVKNMFQFRDDASLTEELIKKCDMAELEYTLKNTVLGGPGLRKEESSKRRKGRKKEDEDDEDDASDVIDDETLVKKLTEIDETGGAEGTKPKGSEQDTKRAANQKAIDEIFASSNVTVSVLSDKMLGGSRAEQERSWKAVHDANAKYERQDAPSKPKKAKEEAPTKSSAWDPSRRRVGKIKSDINSVPLHAPAPLSHSIVGSPSTYTNTTQSALKSVAQSLGIARLVSDTPLAELIKPSDYFGSIGVAKLVAELESLKGQTEAYEAKIYSILEKYKESVGN